MTYRRYFSPPSFDEDRQKNSTARVLYFMLLLTLAILLISSGFFMFRQDSNARDLTVIPLSVVANLTLLVMIRYGRVQLAGMLFILYIWFLPIVLSLLTRGILSPYPTLHILVILVGAIIIHPRFSLLVAVASTLNVTILLFISRDLPTATEFIGENDYMAFAVTNWVLFSITFLTTPVLILYAWRLITQAMDDVRQHERELALRNATLEAEISKRTTIEGELRHSELRFQQIFAYAPMGMAIINEDGRTVVINETLRQILRYDELDLSDKTVFDFIHTDDVEDEKKLVRAMFKGAIENYQVERRLITSHNKALPVSLTVTAVRDTENRFMYAIAMVEDISERKQAETNRIQLEVARQRVEFLREFVSNMTHDLKTPLTTINTSLFLLENSPDPEMQDRQRKTIKLQTTFLTKMIDDILMVARLDSVPDLVFEDTNINQLVQRAREQLNTKAERKNLTMTFDLTQDIPQIPASEDELYRATVNLVENAINYTPENGKVIVRTYIQDGHVGLEVKDSGIGIDTDEIPHIFDRFYRARNARKIDGGTGLGLAIIKQVVDLHQGEISVDSTVGDGTTFKIKFPTNSTIASN